LLIAIRLPWFGAVGSSDEPPSWELGAPPFPPPDGVVGGGVGGLELVAVCEEATRPLSPPAALPASRCLSSFRVSAQLGVLERWTRGCISGERECIFASSFSSQAIILTSLLPHMFEKVFAMQCTQRRCILSLPLNSKFESYSKQTWNSNSDANSLLLNIKFRALPLLRKCHIPPPPFSCLLNCWIVWIISSFVIRWYFAKH
jgi:hypothetical protein